jgi:hypothetical protein
MTHISKTEFWRKIMHDVLGPRNGGAILVIDAENARKGVGKTGLAVGLARLFAKAFNYDFQNDDLAISGEHYLYLLQNHPGQYQPSVVVWDEAVGGGAGDGRRHMTEQNRVMGQAWQTLRTKRIISLVTLPDSQDLDGRLLKLADYRLRCLEKPIGKFQGYKITTPFDSSEARTKALGDDGNGHARKITFPDMDANDDPFYQHLSEEKDKLIDADDTFDADEVLGSPGDDGGEDVDPQEVADEVSRQEQLKTVLRAVEPWDEDSGMSYRDAADLVDYSYSWVRDRIAEYEDGEHRDLVEPPAEVSG